MQTIDYTDFQRIKLKIGTIVRVDHFEKARKPAFKIWVDLGPLGIKKTSAQVTDLYSPESLVGKQVICVCNFPPKQIADFKSEILITGFSDHEGRIVLASVDQPVPNGADLH